MNAHAMLEARSPAPSAAQPDAVKGAWPLTRPRAPDQRVAIIEHEDVLVGLLFDKARFMATLRAALDT